MPAHVQVHGPVPTPDVSVTEGVLPSPQRFAVGVEAVGVPPADPQTPGLALEVVPQEPLEAPPFDPRQLQFQGPGAEPERPETVPGLQSWVPVGATVMAVLFPDPQFPAIGAGEGLVTTRVTAFEVTGGVPGWQPPDPVTV